MDARAALKISLEMADMVSLAYVGDLTDEELMQRPHPACHHINWQLGHLITSEHQMLNGMAPGSMPDLPAGFSEMYTKENSGSDDPQRFAKKDTLLAAHRAQRAGTLALLEQCTEAELDDPTGVDYAPTKAAMFNMQASHWLMHCGQWVIVRRNAGKPIVI